MTKTITEKEKQTVIEETQNWIDTASCYFSRKLDTPEIKFDLSGRAAGMYRVNQYGCCIRYNPYLFAKYFADNLSTTIPHEVAHYVVDRIFTRKARPHGKEWKSVMALFGVNADVRCHYDMSDIPQRRHKHFAYQCDCREHQLGTIRHKRVLNGARYICRYCRQTLSILQVA